MEVKESIGLEELTALLSTPTDAERQRIITMGRQTGRSQLLEAFLTEQSSEQIAELEAGAGRIMDSVQKQTVHQFLGTEQKLPDDMTRNQRRIAEKQMKRLMERGRPAIQNKPKIKKRKKR